MGQILGLGITHYPGLAFQGNLASRIKLLLADPALPEHLRSPASWPAPMREQWSDDEGEAHSNQHRQAMIEQFRYLKTALVFVLAVDPRRPDGDRLARIGGILPGAHGKTVRGVGAGVKRAPTTPQREEARRRWRRAAARRSRGGVRPGLSLRQGSWRALRASNAVDRGPSSGTS